jgi:hypothetical protein
VQLALFHEKPGSSAVAEGFRTENILEKLRLLDLRARRKGLDSIHTARYPLARIGMEVNSAGKVVKNGYGVFHLVWEAREHPEWPGAVMQELADLKKRIRRAHGVPLRFLIWAGADGSAEDKAMYQAVGLLRRGPRLYVLDSTDPAKLKHILRDMEQRSGGSLADALKSTLVIGMTVGTTSCEPVVNLERLSILFDRNGIESAENFLYMAKTGSLLDQFGRGRGYRRVELQLDNGDGTTGRHSAPLTRSSLYALGLAGVNLETWLEKAWLSDEEVQIAWQLSAFLDGQIKAGRDKITLILPKEWAGAALWTKQNFEESLGKSENWGIKIIVDERVKLANYRSPKDPAQDRCFLAVQMKGRANQEAKKIAALRRAGYPMAVLTMKEPWLSRYMQFIHYAVFGTAYLRGMNFVTQTGVQLHKAITSRLHIEARNAGGIEKTSEWSRMQATTRRARLYGALTLYYDRLDERLPIHGADAAEIYASLLKRLAEDQQIEYGELTFFGDTRYNPRGRALRKVLDRGAERTFRTALKMPVDVHEGPAMNHSYHEMIIGHGRALSTVILPEKADKLPEADHTADFHRAQFLATQMALAQRGRFVVALTIKDLEESSITALDDFFKQVASHLKCRRVRK